MAKDRNAFGPAELGHEDPLFERYSNAPYDPLYSAEVAGRATGEALRDPRFPLWVRIIGFIAAAAFLGALVTGFVELMRFTP